MKKKSIKPYIGSYAEAPIFTRDNKYLLTGYRINYNTLKLATCIRMINQKVYFKFIMKRVIFGHMEQE